MSADALSFMRNVLEDYKTKPLPSDVEFTGDGVDLFVDLSECFHYISEDDRRRPPIIKIPIPLVDMAAADSENTIRTEATDIRVPIMESASEPSTFGPTVSTPSANIASCLDARGVLEQGERNSKKFKLKMAYNHYHQEIDPDGCQNDFEYLYHPINYKVTQCLALTFCTRPFCPHYHSATEKELALQLQEQLIKETGYQYGRQAPNAAQSPSSQTQNANSLCKDGTNSTDSDVETGCSSVNEPKGLFIEFQSQIKTLKDLTDELDMEYQIDLKELESLKAVLGSEEKPEDASKTDTNQPGSDQKLTKCPGDSVKESSTPDRETYQLSRITYPRFNKNPSHYPGKKNKMGKQLILNDFKQSSAGSGTQQAAQYFMNQEVKSFEDINTEFKNFSHLDVCFS